MYLIIHSHWLFKRDAIGISLEPNKHFLKFQAIDLFTLNDSSFEFIKHCDGSMTFEQIIEILHQKYHSISIEQLKIDFSELEQFLFENDILFLSPIPIERTGSHYIDYQDLIIPKTISLEITDNCQLQCKHCFNSYHPVSMPRHLDLNTCQTLFRDCKSLNIQSVFITGGEPFLHPEVNTIIKSALQCFNRVTIATNGFILPDDKICEILRNYNVSVQVSIDGNEHFHNYFRNNNQSYQNAYNTIKKLRNYKIEVQVAYTLCLENLKFLEGEVIKLKELGVCAVNLGSLALLGRAQDSSHHPLSTEQFLEINKSISKYCDESFHIGKVKEQEEIIFLEEMVTYPNKCGAGYHLLHIDSSSNVFPCQSITDIKLGQISHKRIFEVLNFKNLKPMFDLVSPTTKLCQNCKVDCMGCLANKMEACKKNECIIR